MYIDLCNHMPALIRFDICLIRDTSMGLDFSKASLLFVYLFDCCAVFVYGPVSISHFPIFNDLSLAWCE